MFCKARNPTIQLTRKAVDKTRQGKRCPDERGLPGVAASRRSPRYTRPALRQLGHCVLPSELITFETSGLFFLLQSLALSAFTFNSSIILLTHMFVFCVLKHGFKVKLVVRWIPHSCSDSMGAGDPHSPRK